MSGNLAYQEERREELIGGKPVMMSPRPSFNHNQISYNISRLFGNYLYGKKCTPIADGMDLYLDEDNQFVPDFMVVCDPDKIKPDGIHGSPDLVVEVLSPSTEGMTRPKRKMCTPAVGSVNTGLSVPTTNLLKSTVPMEPTLSFTIYIRCTLTGSLRRCPRRSGRLS